MNLGCHVSIRGGYLSAAKTAYAIGASSFQYFPKNPRGLSVKTFDHGDASACSLFCARNELRSIAHTTYAVNIAVGDERLREVTVRSLINDLHIAEACGSLGLVVHVGKYKGSDPLQGYKNCLLCLNAALRDWHGNALILLENLAGEGTNMGMTFEESVQLRKLAERPECIGFCLDTCHLFASGLWTGSNWPELEQKADALGYFQHLQAVHLNDSMYPSGSRRDRHAKVGKGHVGIEGFQSLFASGRLKRIPLILETPVDARGNHQDEIREIRSTFSV